MAPLSSLVLAALSLVSSTFAQSDTDNSKQDVKVWAAVAYINHGEKTPSALSAFSHADDILTPIGAQQMLKQGQIFRARYLGVGAKANSSDEDSIKVAPIQGIQTDSIVNSQLSVAAQADEWTVGSAMAFLQGLYPPVEDKFPSQTDALDIERDRITDTTADYPLNGYQYPKILTYASSDPNSAIIDGTAACTEWSAEMASNLTKRPELSAKAQSSKSLYDKLASSPHLDRSMKKLKDVSFWNAYEVYEVTSYLYQHNKTIFENLDNADETLDALQLYATELERAKTSDAVAHAQDPLNVLYTVAGRTLGMRILDQLKGAISSKAERNKLSLMFGSFRPMNSFFSVVGLVDRQNTNTGPLSRIPKPGAAMVIELISDDVDGGMPEENDLQVRFYYYPDAGSQEEPSLFSLYGSGNGGFSIPYTSMKTHMERDGLTPESWCNICRPTSSSSPWCVSDSDDSTGSPDSRPVSKGSSGLSRATAGVIGAVVAAAVFGLLFAVVFGLLGFRIQRPHPEDGVSGGFKGPEKRPSDPDLAMSKGGATHERIGSWEMRDDGAAAVTNDFSRRAGKRTDEDGISFMDATPVRAHESV